MMDPNAAHEEQQSGKLEAAHVLFMDMVGWSRLTVEEQKRRLEKLQEVVRSAEDFRKASDEQRLLRLPTGDGMALVFFGDPEAPLRTAIELGRTLRNHPALKLRMGIHTGPVYRVEDINANMNAAGGGVNIAQRVMDCGDAGHILVSEDTARFFSQVGTWADRLHDIGKTKVKHGVRLHLFSLYVSEAGNPELPRKIRRERLRRRAIAGGAFLAGVVVTVAALLKVYPPPLPLRPVTTQITTNPGTRPVHATAISPNGQYLAYVDGKGIVVENIGSRREAQRLALVEGEEFSFASPNWALAWFPDSERLLVTGPTGDKKLESLWLFRRIGEPRKLREKAWLPAVAGNGRIAFLDAETQGKIWLMDSEEAEPRIAHAALEGDWLTDLAWSPLNTRLAFVETTSQGNEFVGTLDLATGQTTRVIHDIHLTSGPQNEFGGLLCWLPNGRILFVKPSLPGSKGSDLWTVSVDMYTGEATGKETLVRSESGVYLSNLSSTTDGKRIAFLKRELNYSVFLGTLKDKAQIELKPFISEESNNWASGWTPDSRYVLSTSDRNSGLDDVYRQAIGGGGLQTLATGGDAKRAAVAMSDGSSVLYWSWPREDGDNPKHKKLQELPSGQSSPRTLLEVPGTAQFRCALKAPTCVVSEEAKNGLRFFTLTRRFLVAVTLPTSDGYDWDLSPDGSRIAVVHSDVAESEIRIVNLSDRPMSKLEVRPWANFEWIAWAADGKGFYVSSNLPKKSSLLWVGMTGNASVLWRSELESLQALLPSPDGKLLAVTVSSTGKSNAWLIERF